MAALKSSANRQVGSCLNPDGLTIYTIRLFHGPQRDPVGDRIGVGICADPCRMWNSSTYFVFAHVKRKNNANGQDFEIKLNLTAKVKVKQT